MSTGADLRKWKWPDDHTPTDKELAAALPTLSLEERIETVIRKYVGGAVSTYFDGETDARTAHARIAGYLMRKLRPWLPKDALLTGTPGAQLTFEVVVNGQLTHVVVAAPASVRDIIEPALAQTNTVSLPQSEWEARLTEGDCIPLDQPIQQHVGQRLWVNLRAGYFAGTPGAGAQDCVCHCPDGLVREWVSKARAVARTKGYHYAAPSSSSIPAEPNK